jgi:hypothetical protein
MRILMDGRWLDARHRVRQDDVIPEDSWELQELLFPLVRGDVPLEISNSDLDTISCASLLNVTGNLGANDEVFEEPKQREERSSY